MTEERINVRGDPAINIQDFEKNLSVEIKSSTSEKLEMQVDHIDAPIANALRRIMIAEVNKPNNKDSYHGHP